MGNDEAEIHIRCYLIHDMSKMRKFKNATIFVYGNNKFSYIHPQMSSDGLNLPTVPPPPPPPDALYGKEITATNSN